MLEKIMKEKISADHLLYVSLKYTKTCDVIINLLLRWKIMIELAMEVLVERAKKKKKWVPVPDAPRAKLVQLKKSEKSAPQSQTKTKATLLLGTHAGQRTEKFALKIPIQFFRRTKK